MRILALVILLFSFESYATLIAHRGVHQNYYREGLNNETCTAKRIHTPSHEYLENTLESIQQAFNYNADIVEIDIHPTTEGSGPDQLVVFHDWTLNCRTEATCESGCKCSKDSLCVTHEQSLEYLQTLDLGFGYTHDLGRTYPFRGLFKEQMPTLQDILDLLRKYPSKGILVNVKGNTERTSKAFVRIVSHYEEEVRKRLYYPHKYGSSQELEELGVKDEISQKDKKCIFEYLKVGWLGVFPKECHNKKLFIPIRETLERLIGRPGRAVKFTTILWGWPEKFISLAHKHGTRIYASQVDSIDEYHQMKKLDLDGIMTNKIELIGPTSEN